MLSGESVLQDGVMLCVILSSIPLGISVLVGLISSILQAATQIQEQTLGFVPKLCAVIFMLWVLGPWIFNQIKLLLISSLCSNGAII